MSMRSPSGFIRPGYDPLKNPDAPTGVTPTAGNESASIDFTPPVDVGNSAVSEYYAVVQPGDITATSVTPPVAVSGLTNGVEYTTKVWANNSYGPSPYSAESSGFTPAPSNVEDVFSTYLYTGNGSTQTITNGIDLAGEGGLVWTKCRTFAQDNMLIDTARGGDKRLTSNGANASFTSAQYITSFSSTGYSIGNDNDLNSNTQTFASWTFRKAPKFFDVVTYTGDGVAGRTIAHNLGSTPEVMFVKRTDTSGNWRVYHGAFGATKYFDLDEVNGVGTASTVWNNTAPTSTVFSVGTNSGVNASLGTYVAYLFASNAGGFGDDGEQSIISCGSYTGNGSNSITNFVNLGWEPQWVLVKNSGLSPSENENWYLVDNMRGSTSNEAAVSAYLRPNLSSTEVSPGYYGISVASQGFYAVGNDGSFNRSGQTYIYIAIRRGPMATPTSGTEVFSPITATGTEGQGVIKTTNFPVDLQITKARGGGNGWTVDRLRGVSTTATDTGPSVLIANDTGAQYVNTFAITRAWGNTGFQISGAIGNSSQIYWNFRRAPGFFDMVAYKGTGGATTINHNLGAVPEFIIVKKRNTTGGWTCYHKALGNGKNINLNEISDPDISDAWNNTTPTNSVFSVYATGAGNDTNTSGHTFIAYLFATVAGVSKVGSYTGTAANLNVDCGFSAGARFVLIKRTDIPSTGGWYVWDSARGIVSGNDPYLFLNNENTEVTNTDYIDPLASGFTVTSSAPAELNASGGSYIFLAIA